ncbi:MAG: TraB/GumN family protein [Brumimicrobium sp.]
MKLLKLCLLMVTLFTNLFNGFSQDTTAIERSSSLLWEVSGKKVKSPSYIFGTMHLIPREQFLFPESLQEKVRNADLLVMEIGGLSEQMKGMQLMMLEEGELFDYFTEEQADSIFDYSEEHLDYSEEQLRTMFGKMKPFVLIQLMTKEAFGENPASYEMSLEKIAKENEIQIEGLETIEEQMSLFDNLSNEEQVEMVMSSLRSVESSQEETEMLIEVYLSQDIDSLHKYMLESDMDFTTFEDNFLNKRNQKWIPKIKKMIKKNKAFIAVGAGHLGGENGVIQLLINEGYTLKPVDL